MVTKVQTITMNFKPLGLLESTSMPTGLEISFKCLKTGKGTKYKHGSTSDEFNMYLNF